MAALNARIAVVRLLLERGIDLRLCDGAGRTALEALREHASNQVNERRIMNDEKIITTGQRSNASNATSYRLE